MSQELHPLGWQPSEPVYEPEGRRTVLRQSTYWWDKWGWRHRICRMEAGYVINVLGHLERNSYSYAALYARDMSNDEEPGREELEWVEGLESQLWISTTPVYLALEAALEGPAV